MLRILGIFESLPWLSLKDGVGPPEASVSVCLLQAKDDNFVASCKRPLPCMAGIIMPDRLRYVCSEQHKTNVLIVGYVGMCSKMDRACQQKGSIG